MTDYHPLYRAYFLHQWNGMECLSIQVHYFKELWKVINNSEHNFFFLVKTLLQAIMLAELDFDLDHQESVDEYFSDDGFDMNDLDHFYGQVQNQAYAPFPWKTEFNLDSVIDKCYNRMQCLVKIISLGLIAFFIQQWLQHYNGF